MTHQVHAFEPPERFVAGTVGEPGDRTFFLQARGGGRVVSVALEKVQVSLLAEKLEELLTEASRRFGCRAARGAAARRPPTTSRWTPRSTRSSGSAPSGLAFDVDTTTVVIEAIEAGEVEAEAELGDDDEDDDDDEPMTTTTRTTSRTTTSTGCGCG